MKKITLAWLILFPLLLMTLYLLRVPVNLKALPPPHYFTDVFELATPLTKHLVFEDITLEAGIRIPHTQRSKALTGLHDSLGAGACAFDYNQDGWVDLLTLNGSGVTHFYGKPQWWQQHASSISLYKNIQGERFIDVTHESGLITVGWPMGCNTADLDNDGDLDIVISHYGNHQLWRNNGDQTFSDVSDESNNKQATWGTGVSFADVNQDGLLDIYITHYIDFVTNQLTFEKHSGFADKLPKNFDATLFSGQKNQLLINQGSLSFVDKTDDYGVSNAQGRGLSSQWLDLNNDTYPDLMVFNDKGSQNKLYINDKGKRFSDITLQSGFGFTERMSDGLVHDFNQNGLVDILGTTDGSSYLTLYRFASDKDIRFKDFAQEAQLREQVDASFSHWGASAADFNLDGWVDAVIANGHLVPDKDATLIPEGQKNTLLLNNMGNGFIRIEKALSPKTNNTFSSRCVANLDFNNDGAVDMYITHNNGLGQLLKNTLKDRTWIGFQLDSEPANQLGATIRVNFQGRVIQRRFNTANFLCGHDPRWIIGLGLNKEQTKVDKVTIQWPTGTQSDFFNLSTNAYYVVSDKQPEARQLITSSTMNLRSTLLVKKTDNKLTVIAWLIQQKQTELAKQVLSHLSNHTDATVRLKAFKLSQQLPNKQRVGFIQKALNDINIEIVLAAIEYAQTEEDERLIRWLLEKLKSNHPRINCAASRAFQHFFDEEEALVIHKYTALNPLIKVALSHQSPETKICAIIALGYSERYRALTPLLKLVSNDVQAIRLAAIRALGLLKEKAAIDSLQALFLDSQEILEVRTQALIAMVKINPDYPSKPLLERGLKESQENSTLDAYKKVIHALTMLNASNVVIQQTLTAFIDEYHSIFTESTQAKKNFSIEKKVPKKTDDDLQIQALNNINGRDYQSTCEKVFSVNDTLKIQAVKSLRGCLPENALTQTAPVIISWALQQKNAEFYGNLVSLLSGRKERWARDWIKQQLNQEPMNLEQRLQLINNLAEELSSSVINRLNVLYQQALQPQLQASLARVLIQHEQPSIKEELMENFNAAIARNEEDIAMMYAQTLIEVAPTKVLNTLVQSR